MRNGVLCRLKDFMPRPAPSRPAASAFRWRFAGVWLWLAVAAAFSAEDPRPVLGPGATRDEVIDAYGWPNGQSRAGAKEILSYAQGNVTLENGRVERVDFRTNVPWQAPRPRPNPPSPTSVKKEEEPLDFWLTDFDQATGQATRRQARILALFTGPDWSPASRQFHEEVQFHPDFLESFADDFVFLRLDYATRTPQPDALREQNARLREKYGVIAYPSLLILSPAGENVAHVDLTRPQLGATYRDRVIAAVREVRDLLSRPRAPAPAVPPAPLPVAQAAPVPVEEPNPWAGVLAAPLLSAGWLLTGAAAAGSGLAGLLLWLVWRNWTAARTAVDAPRSSRIAEAASGVPAAAEVNGWPRRKLRGVAAALAESDGYEVEARGEGGDVDLAFGRPGEAQPRVLVSCLPGDAGVVSAKRVRELYGAMTAERVPAGWLVAPAGFSAEARSYADQHNIVLVDVRRLLAHLGELPPLILAKVLTRLA